MKAFMKSFKVPFPPNHTCLRTHITGSHLWGSGVASLRRKTAERGVLGIRGETEKQRSRFENRRKEQEGGGGCGESKRGGDP